MSKLILKNDLVQTEGSDVTGLCHEIFDRGRSWKGEDFSNDPESIAKIDKAILILQELFSHLEVNDLFDERY